MQKEKKTVSIYILYNLSLFSANNQTNQYKLFCFGAFRLYLTNIPSNMHIMHHLFHSLNLTSNLDINPKGILQALQLHLLKPSNRNTLQVTKSPFTNMPFYLLYWPFHSTIQCFTYPLTKLYYHYNTIFSEGPFWPFLPHPLKNSLTAQYVFIKPMYILSLQYTGSKRQKKRLTYAAIR